MAIVIAVPLLASRLTGSDSCVILLCSDEAHLGLLIEVGGLDTPEHSFGLSSLNEEMLSI